MVSALAVSVCHVPMQVCLSGKLWLVLPALQSLPVTKLVLFLGHADDDCGAPQQLQRTTGCKEATVRSVRPCTSYAAGFSGQQFGIEGTQHDRGDLECVLLRTAAH